MKFFTLYAIIAIVVASAYAGPAYIDGDIDLRCPQDESSESKTTYIGHESDCAKYYICTNCRSYLMECPKMANGNRLHWDKVEKVCNWPELAKCLMHNESDCAPRC